MDWFISAMEVFTGILQLGIFVMGILMVGYFGLSVARGRQLSINNIGIAILVYGMLLLGIEHIPYQFQEAAIASMNKQAELQPALNAAVRNLTAGVSEPFVPEATATPYIIQTSPPVISTVELPTFEPTATQPPPTPYVTPQAEPTKDPCVWEVGQAPPNPNEGCD